MFVVYFSKIQQLYRQKWIADKNIGFNVWKDNF